LDGELNQEREKRESAEKRVDSQAAEIAGLQISLEKWQVQAENEAKARKESEERFSRDLQSERTARQHEADSLSGEIRFDKMQIESARAIERELRDQFQSNKSSLEIEIATYRQRSNKAEVGLDSARLELAELKGRYEGMAQRNIELLERIKGMTKFGTKGISKPGVSMRKLRR
jgi:chromosome segregation ATPase